jgi:hypothetical protein
MNKINEIIDGIKDRFSNPLVFSFLCAWIVYNWQIVIALFWYDPAQWEAHGCNSIYEFIQNQWHRWHGFWLPFWWAVLYTVFMPIVKIGIQLLYTFIEKHGETKRLDILKDGQVSINKYLSLRDNYEARSKRLEQIIASESAYIELNSQLEKDLSDADLTIKESNAEIHQLKENIRKTSDISLLSGLWKITFNPNGSYQTSETIFINQHDCTLNTNGANRNYGRITKFIASPDGRSLFFLLKISSDLIGDYGIPRYAHDTSTINFPMFIFDVHQHGMTEFRGVVNDTITVHLEKK